MKEHFILFTTHSGNTYLYDAPTNSIHPWNPPLSEEFADTLYNTPDDELEQLIYPEGVPERQKIYVRLWRKKTGAFRNPEPPELLLFPDFASLPQSKLGPLLFADLLLVLSEQCNLRCKYCTYSDFYQDHRRHADNIMTWEVAKKAIDWFFHYNDQPQFHGYPNRNLNIVFYGGEPLINFEVLEKAVHYALEQKKDHYGLVLSVSTNLTLLKDEQIPFFRDHDLFLNVSLDGPAAEHNRYRHFEGGGATSWQVMENLEKIRSFDPDYYRRRVHVLPTINGNSDLEAVYRFFTDPSHDLPQLQMISFLREMDSCEFHKVFPYDPERFRMQLQSLLDIYKQAKAEGQIFHRGEFFYHFLERAFEEMYQRVHSLGLQYTELFTGTCIPGRKFAVTPDGLFHICERINPNFPIGNVEDGYNEEQAVAILNQYVSALPPCHRCWARNFCSVCMAGAAQGCAFDFTRQCHESQKNTLANLAFLYSILEENPKAFWSEDPLIRK